MDRLFAINPGLQRSGGMGFFPGGGMGITDNYVQNVSNGPIAGWHESRDEMIFSPLGMRDNHSEMQSLANSQTGDVETDFSNGGKLTFNAGSKDAAKTYTGSDGSKIEMSDAQWTKASGGDGKNYGYIKMYDPSGNYIGEAGGDPHLYDKNGKEVADLKGKTTLMVGNNRITFTPTDGSDSTAGTSGSKSIGDVHIYDGNNDIHTNATHPGADSSLDGRGAASAQDPGHVYAWDGSQWIDSATGKAATL